MGVLSLRCRLLLTAACAVAMSVPQATDAQVGSANVVGGQATVSVGPNSTIVHQFTDKAIINWSSLSVPSGNLLQFLQPSSSSIALNRVLGGGASIFDGSILANGRVWIINPNGVLFGANASVNVAGLLATTSDIRNQDFLAGNYTFGIPSSNPNAAVVNAGNITAANGGSVLLAAPSVANQGVIQATLGTVVLGGANAFTVDFQGDKLLSFAITAPVTQAPTDANGKPVAALVSNSGTIEADGGTVLLTARTARNLIENVINTTGMISAKSAHEENGEIVLDAGPEGSASVNGRLDASGTAPGTTGGTVEVLGGTVAVNAGATIDASGDAGGGTVLIGGNLHGAGPQPNALHTTVAAGAAIHVDAGSSGNGGTVAVWADETTVFNGAITARGGALGGNGGMIETSGKQALAVVTGTVDASAANGQAGTWLLDPSNIFVQNGGTSSLFTQPDGTYGLVGIDYLFPIIPPITINYFVDPGAIASSTANVVLQASNNITIVDPVTLQNTGIGLALAAGNLITVNAPITTKGGAIQLTANTGGFPTGSGSIVVAAALSTAGGGQTGGSVALTVSGGTGSITLAQNITTAAGAVSFSGKTMLGGAATVDTTNAGAAAAGAGISFSSTLDGAQALTLNSGGAAITLPGAVGSATPLASLTATGASLAFSTAQLSGALNTSGIAQTTFNGAVTAGSVTTGAVTFDGSGVTTTAGQSYGNATLGATEALAGTSIGFTGTVDGAYTLSITGSASFAGAVGSGTALTSLGVNGTAALNGGSIKTSGAQSYGGAVTLGGDDTLTGSNVAFSGSIDGAHALSIVGSGTFAGAVGNGTALSSLSVSGTSTLSGGIVKTSGSQTYSGTVTLGTDDSLTGSSIAFGSALDGARVLTITGNASFAGAVGSGTALSSLSVSGATALNGGSIKTSGGQSFTGAVTLGGDETLTGTSIGFSGTIDGAHALSLVGNASFAGAIGNATALTSLSVSGASAFNGGSIKTAGTQSYTGAVTLGGDETLTGSLIAFSGTIDGAHALSLVGNASFAGAVGGSAALSSLAVSGTSAFNGGSITTTGAQSYSGAVTLGGDETLTGSLIAFGGAIDGAHALTIAGNASFAGAVGAGTALTSLSVSGTSALNGPAIKTAGTQSYSGAVTLGADETLTGSGIAFGGTVDGAHALSIAGNASFANAVGAGTALASLSVSGTSALNGSSVKTGGVQSYTGAVTLGADETLTGASIAFGGTIDGAHALSIAGNASFAGAVGGGTALTSLGVSGTSALNGGVTKTAGAQSYTGAVTLGANDTLTATSVAFGATVDGAHALAITGNATFAGAVGGGTTLASLSVSGTSALNGGAVKTAGTQTYSGAVTLGTDDALTGSTIAFGGAVDGAHLLTINGNASFAGAVGGGAVLAGLSVSGTSALNGGAVTTAGAQTYTGAVTLGTDDALAGTSIAFGGAVDGAHALGITGNASFAGPVGGGTTLASLVVSGTTGLGGGGVKTAGTQAYTGAVTLSGDETLTASSVAFAGPVDGAHALSILGNASFGGAVGSGTALASLSVSGTSALNGGVVKSAGTQTYTGAVTLGTDDALSGTSIAFGGTIDGAHALIVTGNASFAGAVGGGTVLSSLSVSGTSALNGGVIKTAGAQSYTGAVTLGADDTLTATSIAFGGTIDGAHGLGLIGNASFAGAVGAGTALANLSVSGTASLNASVTTAGPQSYSGAVTLTADDTLTGTSIAFGSTVDGAHALHLVGNAFFFDPVGAGTTLASLSVSGTTALNGGSVKTAGAQTYTGAVTLGTDDTLTGTSIAFGGAVDGAHGLSINGNASFAGPVGSGAPLASLSVSGTTALNGGLLLTAGAQSFGGAVTLGADDSLAGSAVTFAGTIDGAHALSVTGSTIFDGAVGAVTPLASLTVNGTSALDGPGVSTAGAQAYNGAVTLGANQTLTGASIAFAGTVDGAHALTIIGNASFGGALGSIEPLTSLGVTGATIAFGGAVGINGLLDTTGVGLTTFSNIAVVGSLDTGAVVLNGGSISSTGEQSYGNATLGADTVLTAGGGITFRGTVNGGHVLTLDGNGTFAGAVGGSAALASLTVNGTSALNGGSVRTTGTQSYDGAVTLGTDETLSGTLVAFGGTVDGAPALSILGNASFAGAVGNGTALASLSVSGASALDGGTIKTVGAQTYTGAVALGTDDALVATTVAFGNTVDGAHALGITGNASFAGAVGNGTALASLSVSGTSALNGGVIKTAGTQTYTGAVTLGSDDALTATLVAFGGTVDGAHALGITGNASFAGAVGNSTALASLSVSGSSALNGGSITTAGAQSYAGAVTLGTDDALSATSIAFGGTIDGAHALSIAGNVSFAGAVGSGTALASLGVSGTSALDGGAIRTAGTQSYTGAVTLGTDDALTGTLIAFGSTVDGGHALSITGSASFAGAVGNGTALASLSVSGASALNGGTVKTAGTQTYAGAVTLGTDDTLTGTNIAFGGTIDGAHALGISGNASFAGAAGGSTVLASLSVSGTSALNGGVIKTAGAQSYTGAVTLGMDDALTGTSIAFGGTVDGAHALSLTGNTSFAGAVGGGTALASLSVNGTSALNGGSVRTSGGQAYDGAVTLGSDDALTGTSIVFAGTVDGAHALSITGNASFAGAVGGGTALASLSVGGSSALNGGSVASTGVQSYVGAVTLGRDDTLTASLVTFGGTVDGAHALGITGNASFAAAVGGGTTLSSLAVSGTSSLNGGVIKTAGAQSYTGAVTLGTDDTLSGTSIAFGGTIDGAHLLSINGSASFAGAVGGGTALASLSVSGTSALNGGVVKTAGTQSYAGAATLGSDDALTGTSIAFGGTVDGAHVLTINGNASFAGAVGGGAALASLSVSGTSALNGGSISTAGTQTYTGIVTLGSDDALAGTSIAFTGTVDGAYTLSITGNASFAGAIGSGTALASLSVSGASALNGGSIDTAGAQTYSGAVTLGAADALTGTTIAFGGTVDGAHALTITGNASFAGAVGSGTALASLSVSGTSALNGGSIVTAGGQSYGGAVTLGTNDTLTDLAHAGITINGTLNGGFNLTVNDAGGAVTLHGTVGAVHPLGNMTVAAASLWTEPVVLAGTLDATAVGLTTFTGGVNAGSVRTAAVVFDGGFVNTTGSQSFGTATVGAALTLQSGGSITLNGAVDGGFSLFATSNSGIAFDAPVGGATKLSSITIEGGPATFASSVGVVGALDTTFASLTTFASNVAADSVTTGAVRLNGGTIATTWKQSYGAATLGGDETLTNGGSFAFDIIFNGTVDGAHALSIVNTSGNTLPAAIEFVGSVGGATPLSSLTASGTTIALDGSVTTAGPQSYSGGLTLGGATYRTLGSAFTETGVTTLAGSGRTVQIDTTGGAGTITFTGQITGGSNTLALAAGGSIALDGVTAANAQFNAVPLTLNSGTYTFGAGATIVPDATLKGELALGQETQFAGVMLGAATTLDTNDPIVFTAPVAGGSNTLTVNGRAASTVTFVGITAGGLAFNSAVPLLETGFYDIGSGAYTFPVAYTNGSLTFGQPTNFGSVLLYGATTFDSSAVGGALKFGPIMGSSIGAVVINAGSGAVTLAGAIGTSWPPPTSLSVTGATITLGGNVLVNGGPVVLNGATTLSGAVTIDTTGFNNAAPAGGNITIAGTIDGGFALGLNAGTSGAIALNGAIGAATPLASLTAQGTTIAFNAPVTLTGALDSSAVGLTTFGGSVIAGSVHTAAVVFNGASVTTQSGQTYGVAATSNPFAIVTSGGTSGGGDFGDDGADFYSGTGGSIVFAPVGDAAPGSASTGSAATLGSDLALHDGGGAILFGGTLDGAHSVAITDAGGAITFQGAVGGVTKLTSLQAAAASVTFNSTLGVTGVVNTTGVGLTTFGGSVIAQTVQTAGAALDGGSVTTAGTQSYGAATLGADDTLIGTSIAFGGPVNGAFALDISGNASFGGAVGGSAPLASLSVSGTTALNGGLVNTGGAQNYVGAVTLGADAQLAANNSTVAFASTVDGAHSLVISDAGGAVTFAGPVGGSTKLTGFGATAASVTFNGTLGVSGTVNTAQVGQTVFTAPVTAGTLETGAVALNGGSVTTTGTQRYDGAATLGTDTTLAGTGVVFVGTLDGAHDLTVAGTAGFGGAVGAQTALTDLTVTGAVLIDSPSITTTGAQTYAGAAVLGTNATLTGKTIAFQSTVDGTYSLVLIDGPSDTTTPSIQLMGDVGGGAALASLTAVAASGEGINLNGSVTTTGSQNYTASLLTLGGSAYQTSGGVFQESGATQLLTSLVTIDTTGGGTAPAGANINFINTGAIQGDNAKLVYFVGSGQFNVDQSLLDGVIVQDGGVRQVVTHPSVSTSVISSLISASTAGLGGPSSGGGTGSDSTAAGLNTIAPSGPGPGTIELMSGGSGGGSQGGSSGGGSSLSGSNTEVSDLSNGISRSLSGTPGAPRTASHLGQNVLLGGLLTVAAAPTGERDTPQAVEPADELYSSWGNEALWDWQ
jgi:filamentous hemagglutinin family protein